MTSSTQVTSEAINRTKTGSRTAGLMKGAQRETVRLDIVKTNSVAMARLVPLTKLVVTARRGHSPSSCTVAGLERQRPLVTMPE